MVRKISSKSIPERIFTTGDIARYCHTTVMQVNRWIKSGALKAFRYPNGQYRIMKDEFRHFLERNGMPVVDNFFEERNEKKILVADDDASIVDALRRLLTSHNKEYLIEVAYDGYETLIKAGDFKPDLLILDIKMPKIDGLEICRRLRHDKSITPGIKILAITGYSEAYDREMVLASGANDYLLKPFDTRSILMSVDKLIG